MSTGNKEADVSKPYFFFNDTATTEIYTLSLHDALPISCSPLPLLGTTASRVRAGMACRWTVLGLRGVTSGQRVSDRKSTRLELQSRQYLVCRLLLENKNPFTSITHLPSSACTHSSALVT